MKITKVTYQKAYIIGPYLQEKIGVEIEVEDGDEDNAFKVAVVTVDAWHKSANPHLQEEKQFPETHPASFYEKTSPMPIIDRSSKEKLEIAIDNAPDLPTLAALKEEASKHNLVSQYMERLIKLTNGNKD